MRSIIFFFLFYAFVSNAQPSSGVIAEMAEAEVELAELSYHMIYDSLLADRSRACFKFIPKLVDALKIKGSYQYEFSNLVGVSLLQPPDKSFRIFTWQLELAKHHTRYYGAIQLKSEELNLFPLYDYSDSLFRPQDAILTPEHWYGAIYYRILPFKHNKKTHYLLFGYNGKDFLSNQKLLDILSFQDGKPVFGAPAFIFPDQKNTDARFILEYKEDATITLNYDEDQKIIIFDHLMSSQDNTEGLYFTYIPDGTYEGFTLKKGLWTHIDKIKGEVRDEFIGPPIPSPVQFDDQKK